MCRGDLYPGMRQGFLAGLTIFLHHFPILTAIADKNFLGCLDIFYGNYKDPFFNDDVFGVIGKADYFFWAPRIIRKTCQRIMLFPGVNYMIPGYIKQVWVVSIPIGIFIAGDLSRMFCYDNTFWNKYFGKQSLAATSKGRSFYF